MRPDSALPSCFDNTSENSRDRSQLDRAVGEFTPVAVVAVLVVTGVALLTALYFGIRGFAFLRLRKSAIKRGLLKGPETPVTPRPGEFVAEFSKAAGLGPIFVLLGERSIVSACAGRRVP